MIRKIAVVGIVLGLASGAAALADDAPKAGDTPQAATAPAATPAQPAPAVPEHLIIRPSDLKWVEAPPSLPKGAKMAMIHGDMTQPAIFAVRAMLPAGYKVPPHFHPADENVTVISGELYMGMGDTWDESKGHAIPAGGVSIMPAGMHHFAWAKRPTVIQIHAIGPWGITYVNPQDDPRNQMEKGK